jgi:hypothetical protein
MQRALSLDRREHAGSLSQIVRKSIFGVDSQHGIDRG